MDPTNNRHLLIQQMAQMETAQQREGCFDQLWQEILATARGLNLKAPMNEKLFAIIQGNQVIAHSPYEGHSPIATIRYLVEMLQFLDPANPLIHLFEGCFEWQKKISMALTPILQTALASEISARIAQLSPNEVLLLPGGMLGGSPGHFLLYEVTRTSFRIYNTGDGLDQHDKILIGDRIYYYPVFGITGIAPDALQSVPFWRMLVELTVRPNVTFYKKTEEIYLLAQMMLPGEHPKLLLTSEHRPLLVLPQTSGICSWQVLLAYLKIQCGSDYADQIIFQLKFWSCAQAYASLEGTPSPSLQIVFHRALASIAKRLEAVCRDSDDVIRAHALLTHLSAWLTDLKNISTPFKDPRVPLQPQNAKIEDAKFFSGDLATRMGRALTKRKKNDQKDKPNVFIFPPLPKGETLYVDLRQWVLILQELEYTEKYKAICKIHELLNSIPVPSDNNVYWSKIPSSDLQPLFREFNKLLIIYIDPLWSWKLKIPYMEMATSLFHFYAILDWLFMRMSDNSPTPIRQYGLALPKEWFFFKNPYAFALSDFRHQVRWSQMEEYFTQRNEGKSLRLFSYPPNPKWSIPVSQNTHDRIADFHMIHTLLLLDPSLLGQDFRSSRALVMASMFARSAPSPECPLPEEYFVMRGVFYTLQCILDWGSGVHLPTPKLEFKNIYADSSGNNLTVESDAYRSETPSDWKDERFIDFIKNKARESHPCWRSQEFLLATLGNISQNAGLYIANGLPEEVKVRLGEQLKLLNKDESITSEELARWIDIRVGKQNRLVLCLRYYQDNILALEKSEQRHFLAYNLLEEGQLTETIRENFLVLQILKDFIQRAAVIFFKDPEKVEITLSLLDCLFSLETLSLTSYGIPPETFIPYREVMETLLHLRACLPQQPQIDLKIMQWLTLQTHLTPQDLLLILRAWMRLASSEQSKETFNESRKYYYQLEGVISSYLNQSKERDDLLNELAHLQDSTLTKQKWKGSYPLFKSGDLEINLVKGYLLQNKQKVMALPPGILNWAVVKKLFKLTVEDHFVYSNKVYVSDVKGLRFTITENNEFFLEKKVNEEWLSFLDKFNPMQAEKIYAWIQRQGEEIVILFQTKSGETLYRVEFGASSRTVKLMNEKRAKRKNGIFNGLYESFRVIRVSDGHVLLNHMPPFVESFLKVENLNSLNVWMNPTTKRVSSIELLKLKISFRIVGDQIICDQLKGMRVITAGFFRPFAHFNHYLALESREGKIYLFIAKRRLTLRDPEGANPLVRPIEVRGYFDEEQPDSFLFEIDEVRKECLATSLEAQIYLAKLYAADGNFRKSLECLKGCFKNEPYSEKEIALLKAFPEHHTPESIALLLYIDWLCIQSGERIGMNHFRRYIQALPYIPDEMRLTIAQEQDLTQESRKYIYPDSYTKEIFEMHALALQGRAPAMVPLFPLQTNQSPLTFPKQDWKLQLHPDPPLDFGMSTYQVKPIKKDNTLNVLAQTIDNQVVAFVQAFLSDERTRRDWMFAVLLMNQKLFRDPFLFAVLVALWKNPQPLRDLLEGPVTSHLLEVYNNFLGEEFKKAFQEEFKKFRGVERWIPLNELSSPLPARQVPLIASTAVSVAKTNSRSSKMFVELYPETLKSLFQAYFVPVTIWHNETRVTTPTSSPLMKLISQSPKANELYTKYLTNGSAEPVASTQYRPKDLKELGTLKQRLTDRAKGLYGLAQASERYLLTQANATPLDRDGTLTVDQLKEALKHRTSIFSQRDHKVTLEELVMCLLQRDIDFAGLSNPFLTAGEKGQLKAALVSFLKLRCEIQQIERSLSALETLLSHYPLPNNDEGVETEFALAKKVEETLASIRHFDPLLEPHLLAFEFLSQMMYREKQVQLILQALDPSATHALFELPMGQGKTKMILPSFALMLADGTQIVFVVVPQAHVEQVFLDLSQFCRSHRKRIYRFNFDRSSDVAPKAMDKMIEELIKTRLEKGFVLCTRESLQSLLLKACDCVTRITRNENSEEHLQTLHSLVRVIEILQESVMIGDEIHHLMKSLFEMNFTFGKGQSLPPERWNITLFLFMQMAKAGMDVSKPFNIALNPDEKQQWEKMKGILAGSIVAAYGVHFREGDPILEYLRDYLLGRDVDLRPLLDLYTHHPNLATDIVIAKEQLNNFIPHTMAHEWNVHFGRSKNPAILYAIPYEGKDNPSEGSEYSNTLIMINYTIQTYLRNGLDATQFKDWLISVKNQRARELSLGLKNQQSRIHKIEEAFEGDLSLYEANLKDAAILARVCDTYGRHPVIVMDYLNTTVFPTVKTHRESINSNAQHLGDYLFAKGKVIALSGTIYNAETLPQGFIQNAHVDEEGKKSIIRALLRPKNQRVTALAGESTGEILEEMAAQFATEPSLRALIDGGALLKGKSNLEAAKQLQAKLQHFKGVVLFDDEKQSTVFLKQGKSKTESWNPHEIKEGDRLSLYDHLRSFGADIPQLATAGAATTVDKQTAFYQILQAVMRMRQAEQGQYVRFFLLNYLADALVKLCEKELLTGFEILLMGIWNEAELFEKELIAATQHKVKHVLCKELFAGVFQFTQERLLNVALLQSLNFGKAWNQIIVDKADESLFHLYLKQTQLVPPESVFKELAHNYTAGLDLFDAEVMKRMDEEISFACKKLPKLIPSPLQTLEKEVQKQEEKFVEQKNQTDPSNNPLPEVEQRWHPLHLVNNLNHRLARGASPDFCATLLESIPDPANLRSYQVDEWMNALGYPSLFDATIFFTHNALTSASNLPYDFSMKFKPIDFFLEFRPSAHVEGIEATYLALSIEEANAFKQFCQKPLPAAVTVPISYQLHLRDIHGARQSTYAYAPDLFEDSVECEEKLKRALVQIAYLDGREFYPAHLEQPLKQWMDEVVARGGHTAMAELLFKMHENRAPKAEFGKGNFFTLLQRYAL